VPSESGATESPSSSTTAGLGKVRFLDRCQPWLTVLSPIIAVLSFFAGTLYSAANFHQTEEATAAQQKAAEAQQAAEWAGQWRQALQTVGFSETNLIPTAFLMQSFEDDPQYGSSARQIERTALDQTSAPQTFDLVFDNMLANLHTPDQVNDLIDIGHELDRQLYGLWQEAAQGQLKGSEPKTFAYFLQNPGRFYPAKAQQPQLNRALVLMWQLDTFSSGMACVWGTDPGCPHPPLKELKLDDVLIVNTPLPNGASVPATLRQMTTCTVEPNELEAGYHCKR
jgi:hypothetical protein